MTWRIDATQSGIMITDPTGAVLCVAHSWRAAVLAMLSEETRKWIAEQERLKRAARHARRGRTSLIIHETTL